MKATFEITITNPVKKRLILHERFEISPELAEQLIAKIEALIAELAGSYHITRTVRPNGSTVVSLERSQIPPVTRPHFADLYRQPSPNNALNSGESYDKQTENSPPAGPQLPCRLAPPATPPDPAASE